MGPTRWQSSASARALPRLGKRAQGRQTLRLGRHQRALSPRHMRRFGVTGVRPGKATREIDMTTYPGEDDGLEATEVPATPSSAFDPDQGVAVEAEGADADAGGFGAADGPGNADSGD